MSLDQYLRDLDASFRDHDGPSMARYLGADAGEGPPFSGFVAYLKEVRVSVRDAAAAWLSYWPLIYRNYRE